MSTKTDNAETRSLHLPALGHTGQTLDRPTAAGWWWVRTHRPHEDSSEWAITHVVEQNGVLGFEDEFNDGEFVPRQAEVEGRWSEWAGPLVPPCSQSAKLTRNSGEEDAR